MVDNKIMVSIAMITYNHEKFIAEAINGVLMQKCNFDFELIISNDNSPDDSNSIIQQILKEHPKQNKIRYIIRKTNLGITHNFVDTIKQGRGKYIALCEGDDYWTDPLKLQKQVDFMEKNLEYSMVCHNALVINVMNGTSNYFFNLDHKKRICSTKDVFGLHFCPTASILFRKNALRLEDFFTKGFAGDMMLVLLLSLKGLLYRMDDVMCVYRKTASGATEANRMRIKHSWMNRIQMFKHFNRISNFKFSKYINIEVQILENRIRLSNTNTKIFLFTLKVYMKILFMRRKKLFA